MTRHRFGVCIAGRCGLGLDPRLGVVGAVCGGGLVCGGGVGDAGGQVVDDVRRLLGGRRAGARPHNASGECGRARGRKWFACFACRLRRLRSPW